MAIVRIPKEGRTIVDPEAVSRDLAGIGIGCERWAPAHEVGADSPADEILAAYVAEIARLKAT
jgi:cupin superfamily acireductone dioxygenase involved in methionine salvage